MHLRELKQKSMGELVQMAKGLNIEGAAGLRKQELIFALLQAHAAQDQSVYGDGVLECLPDGFGFLRLPITTTCRAPTTSTFRRRRSAASTSARAIA